MEPNRNRQVIVTGATGLIGQKLIERLTKRGDQAIAFVRNPERDRQRAPGASRYVEWSVSKESGEWRQVLQEADAVVNLAGAPIAERWTDEQKEKIYNSRIAGTRHLVEAMGELDRKPSVLVNGSAVGYYGASTTEVVNELSPSGDDFMARVCSDWEAEALRAEGEGVRVALIRIGIVLSPDGGALAKLLTPFRLFVGGTLGSGDQPWPWVHIDDLLDLILYALDNQQLQGPLLAVAPEQISNWQFSKALGHVLHRPSIFPLPPFILRMMLGEGAVAILSGQRVWPERTLNSGFDFNWKSVEEALRNLVGEKKLRDR